MGKSKKREGTQKPKQLGGPIQAHIRPDHIGPGPTWHPGPHGTQAHIGSGPYVGLNQAPKFFWFLRVFSLWRLPRSTFLVLLYTLEWIRFPRALGCGRGWGRLELLVHAYQKTYLSSYSSSQQTSYEFAFPVCLMLLGKTNLRIRIESNEFEKINDSHQWQMCPNVHSICIETNIKKSIGKH